MSEIIDLTKNSIGIANLCNMHFFCEYGCAHGSTRYIMSIIVPIVNIAMTNNFKHCHVYTTRFSQ